MPEANSVFLTLFSVWSKTISENAVPEDLDGQMFKKSIQYLLIKNCFHGITTVYAVHFSKKILQKGLKWKFKNGGKATNDERFFFWSVVFQTLRNEIQKITQLPKKPCNILLWIYIPFQNRKM